MKFTMKIRFKKSEKEVRRATLFPLFNQIEKFAEELENIERRKLSLSYIFNIFMTVAQFQDLYSLQRVKEFCEVFQFFIRF